MPTLHVRRKRNRSSSDPSGPAERLSIRLPPAVHAETLAAAERAGLPWSTWAARELEAASATTRPRFGTLEEVLRYAASIPAGPAREAFLLRLAPIVLDDWWTLRDRIASAWVSGREATIRDACERFAKGER